jgi:hypothetical protein
MQAISFSFTPESSEDERAQALDAIREWLDVKAVDLVSPHSKSPVVCRMATLLTKTDEKAAAVLKKLQQLPAVATASLPATRSIVKS